MRNLRLFRAFVWLRWRFFVNALTRGHSRDTLERVSRALADLVPIIIAVMMVPGALALAGVGAFAGWQAGVSGTFSGVPYGILRYGLLAALAFAAAEPLIFPSGRQWSALPRMMLLPIPRHVLYAVDLATGLAMPWIGLSVPLVAFVPLGLAVAGRLGAALVALVAGLAIVATLLGVALLSSTIVHLLLRNRRRGEIVVLALMLLVMTLSMLPGLLEGSRPRRRSREQPRERPAAARQAAPPPAWVTTVATVARDVTPSEQYAAAIARAPRAPASALEPLAGLVVAGAGINWVCFRLFRRALESPGGGRARRARESSSLWSRRLPGLTPAASAVAMAHVRLVLRTPRGRTTLFGPMLFLLLLAVMMVRAGGRMQVAFLDLSSGVALAAFGAGFALLSFGQIALNQFAVDRAGLTLQLLGPVSERELVVGKAVGNGLLLAGQTLVATGLGLALSPEQHPALWVAVILGGVGTYLALVPVFAALSAMFPYAADLGKMGRSGTPHALANFVGGLVMLAAIVPPIALALLGTRWLDSAVLAAALTAAWCALAALVARVLLTPLAALVARRRENLAMVAQGR